MSSIDEHTPLLTPPEHPTANAEDGNIKDATRTVVREVNEEVDEEEEEKLFQLHNRRRLYHVLPALAIGSFLAAADQTIVVSSHSKIGTELGALDKTSWLATG